MAHKDYLYIVNQMLDSDTPIMDRRMPVARRDRAGKNTRLPQNFWFAAVFELNELHAARGEYEKILNDKQILHNWELEFKDHLKQSKTSTRKPCGALASGKVSLGMLRKSYRLGTLYTGQIKPILCSFRYSRDKEPRRDGRTIEMLLLNDIREICMSCKIADPRFFSASELTKIRAFAKKEGNLMQWGIPSPTQYEQLNETVAGGIYGTYKLYDNPYNDEWSPPEED